MESIETLRKSEYELLFKERLQYQRLRTQTSAFMVLALATFLGLLLGSADKDSLLEKSSELQILCAFTPYLVLIPSILLIIAFSRHISSIGAYLAVYHEGAAEYWGYNLSNFIRRSKMAELEYSKSLVMGTARWGYFASAVILTVFSAVYCLLVLTTLGDFVLAHVLNALLAFGLLIASYCFLTPRRRVELKRLMLRTYLVIQAYCSDQTHTPSAWLRDQLSVKPSRITKEGR